MANIDTRIFIEIVDALRKGQLSLSDSIDLNYSKYSHRWEEYYDGVINAVKADQTFSQRTELVKSVMAYCNEAKEREALKEKSDKERQEKIDKKDNLDEQHKKASIKDFETKEKQFRKTIRTSRLSLAIAVFSILVVAFTKWYSPTSYDELIKQVTELKQQVGQLQSRQDSVAICLRAIDTLKKP